MPCTDCKFTAPYLHHIGVLEDELFKIILEKHKNKDFYQLITELRMSPTTYCLAIGCPRQTLLTYES